MKLRPEKRFNSDVRVRQFLGSNLTTLNRPYLRELTSFVETAAESRFEISKSPDRNNNAMKVKIHTVLHETLKTAPKTDSDSRFIRSVDPGASYKVDKRVKRKNEVAQFTLFLARRWWKVVGDHSDGDGCLFFAVTASSVCNLIFVR